MKDELNIDNVIDILNSESNPIYDFLISNGHNVFIYNKVIKIFLDYFFDDEYSVDSTIHNEEKLFGATVLLNENMIEYYMQDITRLQFISMYPNIMIKLWEDGKLNFNINEFPIIFRFLVQNCNVIKNNSKLEMQGYRLLKFLINYTFRATMIKNSIIQVDNINKVIKYYRDNLVNLFNDYPKNVIYIDTDIIYFDFLDNSILNKYIKPLGIPYEINNDFDGLFSKKKKYLTFKNTKITRGYKIYDSKFKKDKERMKKLNKINNIFNEKEIQRDNS